MMSEPTPANPGGTPPGARPPVPPASSPLARVPWRTTSTRPIYRNRWIDVREDIGVLPFLDRDTVLLVGQYRYVARDFFWEIPTGGQHPGETIQEAAQRELAEEAGHEAGRLVKLCDFHTSKSILREVAHLYLAEDLRPAPRPADHTEFIERRAFPFAEVLAMVVRGEIKDAMTIVAVLHAARRRGM